MPHSLSCTVRDWERIRDLAERSGKLVSHYIVDRVRRDEGPDDPEKGWGNGLALDEREQLAMHDAVLRAEELVSVLASPAGENSPDLCEAVRTLFESRLDEMDRAGNQDVMKQLLERTTGPERAADMVPDQPLTRRSY